MFILIVLDEYAYHIHERSQWMLFILPDDIYKAIQYTDDLPIIIVRVRNDH